MTSRLLQKIEREGRVKIVLLRILENTVVTVIDGIRNTIHSFGYYRSAKTRVKTEVDKGFEFKRVVFDLPVGKSDDKGIIFSKYVLLNYRPRFGDRPRLEFVGVGTLVISVSSST